MEKDLNLLLEQIKDGDETSFALLSEQYRAVTDAAVKRFAPSFGIGDADADGMYGEDDLRQEAMVALYRAALSYDPDEKGRDVSFGLYAKICINNALISALRKYRSEKKKREAAKTKGRNGAKNAPGPFETIASREDAAALLAKIREQLSGLERQVFDYYIVGKSAGEIAERLGRSEKSVSNALYRMKVKVRGLLKNQ
ncbi:MAG: sigma-70 family RNA polymerase sigma factor [Clostridia bacterium]|nr:sigma-70 family RNA polymerase sigma factor [Clostridia bacterium]